MILLPIPIGLFREIGLGERDIIQVSVANGRSIIEKAELKDLDCDRNCEGCIFVGPGSDQQGRSCLLGHYCDNDEDDEYD